MSAAAALPRDSGNVSNTMKTNNALTTDFFFDTGPASFDAIGTTPSKNVDAWKSQRPPHSSLLATPLNRSSGGQVKQKPSPSILESKYLSKPVPPSLNKPTTVAFSPINSGAKQSPTPLSAAGKTSNSPAYSTPLSRKFTAAAGGQTTTPPSASLLNASSDIKARLRKIAATSPLTTGTPPSSRSYSSISRPVTSPSSSFSAAREKDFRISAASSSGRTNALMCTPTPHSTESLAARSRANHMQGELKMREFEVQKLAAAAAEARKERDEQKLRADKFEAIAKNTSTPPPPRTTSSLYHDKHVAQQAQCASTSPSSTPPANDNYRNTTVTTSVSSDDAQTALIELRREAETLRQHVEMAASELQGQWARADAAEERLRLVEARAGAESSAYEAKENETCSLRQQVASMQMEVMRLATDVAVAEDRAGLAENSLVEERSRSRGGLHGHNNNTSTSSSNLNSAALTEVALTAQVRALATQLKVAKTEAASAQQELAYFKAEYQGQAAVHEGTTASVLSENWELQAALAQVSENVQLRGEELEQARGAVARLAAENAALHAALKDRDEQYISLTASNQNKNINSADVMARAHAAETQLAMAQQELKAAKTRIAEIEHAMSKNQNSRTGGHHQDSMGPSPLRDIVGSLRTELEDRELRLAALEEDLATERRRAGDLHRQVLDQAVEIDDLQRKTHHGDDILRKELEQARKEAHAAAQELAEVRHRLQSSAAVSGDASSVEVSEVELRKERDALRVELDARDSEVMALQGQLNMLLVMKGRGTGAADGVGEVENWLTGA